MWKCQQTSASSRPQRVPIWLWRGTGDKRGFEADLELVLDGWKVFKLRYWHCGANAASFCFLYLFVLETLVGLTQLLIEEPNHHKFHSSWGLFTAEDFKASRNPILMYVQRETREVEYFRSIDYMSMYQNVGRKLAASLEAFLSIMSRDSSNMLLQTER